MTISCVVSYLVKKYVDLTKNNLYSRKKLEKKHWAEMVENPRRPVIHWHVLQVLVYFNLIYTSKFSGLS